MSSDSGSSSGSSGEVTADYYGPDSSLVDEVALTGGGGDSGAVTADYYGGGSTTSPTTSVGGSDIDSTYTAGGADFIPTNEPTIVDTVTDYVTGGGLIGTGLRTVSDILEHLKINTQVLQVKMVMERVIIFLLLTTLQNQEV